MTAVDKEGSGLDSLTTLASTDKILCIDVSVPKTANITRANLMSEAWGKLSVTGNSTGQTLATADTFEKVTQFSAEVSGTGITASHANDKMTVTRTGVYVAYAQMVVDVDAADTYRYQFFWNSVAQDTYVEEIRSATGRHTVIVHAMIAAGVGAQDLELHWKAVAGTRTLTVAEGSASVHMVSAY